MRGGPQPFKNNQQTSPHKAAGLESLAMPPGPAQPGYRDQERQIRHGFAFFTNNPHAQEFLKRLNSGEDRRIDRFRELALELQNWDRGNRADNLSPRLVATAKAVKVALATEPPPWEAPKLELWTGTTEAPLPRFPSNWFS
jgi:hypothetical protein